MAMSMSYARWQMERGGGDITASTSETEKHIGLCRCKISLTLTLKYHRPAPGLATLDFGLYVKPDQLGVYKKMPDDPINFARLLAVEIFTTVPLSACSVTKKGGSAIDYHQTTVERAKRKIWNYVIKCAERSCVTGSVREYQVTQNTECIMKAIELKLEDIKRAGQRELDDERLKENLAVHDTNDSRWTLKHPEPGPGLVELIQHSGVYVDAGKLEHCTSWSLNSTILMAMLLHEVFTMCALTACAEDDAKKQCDISKLDSLGLHEDAVVTVVKFVEDYARRHGWNMVNNRIMRDICWYLNKIRRCEGPSYLEPREIYPYPKSFDDPLLFDERRFFFQNRWDSVFSYG